jgi:hypothetical protein
VRLLDKTNNEANAKAAALAVLDTQIAEFREEHRKIQEATAKFTVYMQQNSITVYNDAALEYLNHLIREEKVRVQIRNDGDVTRLKALEKERKEYEAYVDTIHTARKRGLRGAVPDERGVTRLVNDLYSMKHYGTDLRKVADTVSRAYAATFRETAYRVYPKSYWMRMRGHNSNGRQPTNTRAQPYRSMLDPGPSSGLMSPSRRAGNSQRRKAFPDTLKGKDRPKGDTPWQAPRNGTASHRSPANGSTSRSEKAGDIFSVDTDDRAEVSDASGEEHAARSASHSNRRKSGELAGAKSYVETSLTAKQVAVRHRQRLRLRTPDHRVRMSILRLHRFLETGP